MQLSKQILAKDVIMRAKKGGVYRPFAAVRNVEIHITAGLLDVVSNSTGNWAEYVYDKVLQWDVSLSGVCLLADEVENAWTMDEIVDLQTLFESLDIELTMTDSTNTTVWSGTVLIPELGITAAIQDGGEPAVWNMRLQGTGALNKAQAQENYILSEDGFKILLEDNEQ